MGRRKIEIKAIKDDRNRSVTFLKRKGGLFKKAHELAVLCSVDVAVIIFGHNKKLYEFSSCDMRETLTRYQYCGAPHEHKGPEDFNGKRDDDDDEDETTPAPEEAHQTPPQNAPPMIPTHVTTHPGFQHVNHAPSASPPIGNDQGRSSMPPSFASEQQQPQRTISLPEGSTEQMAGPTKPEGSQSPPHQRSLSSKSRSIFTPIDDRGSVLARHFGVGPPSSPPSQVKAEISQGADESKPSAQTAAPPPRRPTDAPRPPSVVDIKPPARTNSGQIASKRPQLKVQIPSESSDRGSATGDSSSRDSAGNKTLTPAKANPDGSHSGVVLPPPSPSAGAILSAGAQGPPNPFARPPPPGAATQNNNSYNNNNIETPISALPSRFVSDALLPSPSSFFPEWGFGRSGPDSNMLPSPLTFPTPAAPSGPSFAREDEQDKKRKSPDSGSNAEGSAKKAKT
ncbi:hypothetical protein HFD88_002980 [Aspergillus terreus]|nr:hypothetical protein HFD88_002980 [Aspergillus terreus]